MVTACPATLYAAIASVVVSLRIMNFLQLTAQIPDKDSAIQFLRDKNILHNPRICTNGDQMKLYTTGKDRWVCSTKDCRESKQVRQDTLLNNSRLDFRTILRLLLE